MTEFTYMEIERALYKQVVDHLKPNKVNVITGTRRVGKTFLVQKIIANTPYKVFTLEGEDIDAQNLLSQTSIANYQRLFSDYELLVIDEAQAIPDIGKKLKLIVDHIKGLRIIATGSSALDLAQQSGEPLTGRAYFHNLYPVAQQELLPLENALETRQRLEERLVYGSYPELFQLNTLKEKEAYLKDLVNAYLLKDILSFEGVRNAEKVKDLLRLIAYQVGKEVSLQELGVALNISKNTVEKYLDLLSKVFILKRIGGFSKNLRKEVIKSSRWFFHDNGVRNTVINDLRPLALRTDTGELWENYLISERIKTLTYAKRHADLYFWRTYDQQEVDWLEMENGSLSAFEFKWREERVKTPVAFANAYPDASFQLINRENYLDFIS
ncbi:putative AAA+ superfamily ATPase [Dyadobacter sp. BE32]|uniref:AAA+ superfamily ATPase n=2 Tax=Spirosomataceae TaxID=2896860 RepID=A0ABU1QP79_9BACT|nr:putative AAA+ superfamily ATPase [Dyadobacter fermentans]MDR7040711.1 putative AAA+ superfamily ATPase [Dyadobacter sp. BE242]MDR7260521.1 putative AAA+ superfamily ATPase [Dyadobacter sp. BE32]